MNKDCGCKTLGKKLPSGGYADVLNSCDCRYPAALEVILQLQGMIILIATEYHFLSCMNPAKPRDFRTCVEDSNCGAATAILKETEQWGE